MDKETLEARVLHLREVERLSIRQIAHQLGIGRNTVRRIIKGGALARSPRKALILDPYRQLIATWYGDYPRLKAKQIYERLIPYGYLGSTEKCFWVDG